VRWVGGISELGRRKRRRKGEVNEVWGHRRREEKRQSESFNPYHDTI